MRTDTKGHEIVERRKFLRAGGALLTAGLAAGCAGDGGTGGSGDGGTGGTDATAGGEGTVTGSGSSFPSEQLTAIVPFGPGGGFDFYTRTVAKYIGEKDYLPTRVQVRNVEGSGGVLGGNQIYNADPDGYTFGIWYMPGLARSQIIRPDTAEYDMRELTPYPSAAGKVPAVAVRSETGVTNTEDFVQAVNNEELTFGSEGPLSAGRLIPVALGRIGGLYDMERILPRYVYFDGKGEWFTAIKRGDVDVMAGSYSSILPFVEQSEDLEMLLVLSQDDTPPDPTPDAQTFADVSVDNPGQAIALTGGGEVYRVFVAPPDIPEERAETVRTAIRKAIQDPDLQAEAAEANRPISFADSGTVDETLTNYIDTWQNNTDLLDTLKENR